MRRIINDGELAVDRRRDPEGNYIVVMKVKDYENVKDKVNELGLVVELASDLVLIKSKSWSKVSRLINYARSRGIKVRES